MEYNKTNEEIVISEEKLKKIRLRVFHIERENFKTKRLKDNEVIDRIIKTITQEVDNVN